MRGRFCFRFRSLVAMLLAFCMVSASMWIYSAEAMADAVSGGICVVAFDADSGDHAPSGKICDHGCHAQNHLMGLDSAAPVVSVTDAAVIPGIEGAADFANRPCDGPFRPPRSFFQA
jgi:hypothetical protein